VDSLVQTGGRGCGPLLALRVSAFSLDSGLDCVLFCYIPPSCFLSAGNEIFYHNSLKCFIYIII
jgi:hypothetical protein